jgi:hypothetical protein
MMRWWLVVALVACKSDKPPPQPDNADCKYASDCASGICRNTLCSAGQVGAACNRERSECARGLGCFEGRCRLPGRTGDKCLFEADCDLANNFSCYKQTCQDKAGEKRKDEEDAASERKAFKDKLEQAGLDVPKVAERGAPASSSTALRTVTSKAKQAASAACATGERLVSGGCKADHVLSSYPSSASDKDTLGGTWNCTAQAEVTAFALCSR